MKIIIDDLGVDPYKVLFSEELGAVIQVADEHFEACEALIKESGLEHITYKIGNLIEKNDLSIHHKGKEIIRKNITVLHRLWSEMTCRMQTLRDNPVCAEEEYNRILDENDPGMQFKLTFDTREIHPIGKTRPKIAILREQGINGQVEMAAAFDRAGFESFDVHMTDLFEKRFHLKDFDAFVACGGFSYGDVLGAGSGWAKSILFSPYLKDMFEDFFHRKNKFVLGVCNGCQMIAQLKDIIPGAADWPHFGKNRSEQFEARFVSVEILDSPSIFFKGMTGSILGIPVAHGEGFTDFSLTGSKEGLENNNQISLRFVDNYGNPSTGYPLNPNGSIEGITGFTTRDGRVTIMMPHPERVFRNIQFSYKPDFLKGDVSPWLKMFQNARQFIS